MMFSRYFPGVQTSCPSFGAVTAVESSYVEIDCLFLVEMTMDRGVPFSDKPEKNSKMVRETPITFIFTIFQVAIHLGVSGGQSLHHFSEVLPLGWSMWQSLVDMDPFKRGMALNMKVS